MEVLDLALGSLLGPLLVHHPHHRGILPCSMAVGRKAVGGALLLGLLFGHCSADFIHRRKDLLQKWEVGQQCHDRFGCWEEVLQGPRGGGCAGQGRLGQEIREGHLELV